MVTIYIGLEDFVQNFCPSCISTERIATDFLSLFIGAMRFDNSWMDREVYQDGILMVNFSTSALALSLDFCDLMASVWPDNGDPVSKTRLFRAGSFPFGYWTHTYASHVPFTTIVTVKLM